MCTRILWDDARNLVKVVGRVMDWPLAKYRPDVWAFPAGGNRVSETSPNPHSWPIKHSSLVVPITWNVRKPRKSVEVGATTDGINEKGLAGHTLWLAPTKYPPADGSKPTLNVAQWLQYYLDRFATIDEVEADAKKEPFQLVPPKIPTGNVYQPTADAALHLTLEDSRGESLVIDFVDGKQHIHRGDEYSVITNSLSCDPQTREAAERTPIKEETLPGSSKSDDRFIRAWHYLWNLPEPTNERETVAFLLSVLRNVSYPFRTFDPKSRQNECTRWRSVINLTRNKKTNDSNVYYFESTTNPNIIWVDLARFKLSQLKREKRLNLPALSVAKRDLVGEVTDQFVYAERSFVWATPDDVPVTP